MKHLLTALIAVLVLVLPLQADKAPAHPSIRILDHEGNPIEGLVVRLVQTSEDTDPLTYDDKPALDFARSNANGVAVFETVDVRDLLEGNRFAVGPSTAGGLVYLPSIPSDQRQELISAHRKVSREHSWPTAVEYRQAELVEGTATLTAPESVRCTIKLNPDVPESYMQVIHLFQRQGGARQGQPPFTFTEPIPAHFTVAVPRGKPGRFAVSYQNAYRILDYTAQQAAADFTLNQLESAGPSPAEATLTYRAESWQRTTALSLFLYRIDGAEGYSFDVPRPVMNNEGGYDTTTVDLPLPSGDFIMLATRDGLNMAHVGVFSGWWGKDFHFDTLLRLRRGEDLPHLKRITIPEGGTVELSTEDFLDPPADQGQVHTIRIKQGHPFVRQYQANGGILTGDAVIDFSDEHMYYTVPPELELKAQTTEGDPVQIALLYSEGTLQPANIEVCALFDVIEAGASHTYSPFDKSAPEAKFVQVPSGMIEFDSNNHLRKLADVVYLLRSDGSCGYAFRIPFESKDATGNTNIRVPSGNFVVSLDLTFTTKMFLQFESMYSSPEGLWASTSPFDTLLRIRRGEDLPHLKRITIPEGGTVELSSETFLDPPAEADPR